MGAYDFIEKPFKADRLILVAERALETSKLRREVSDLKQRSGETFDLIGMSSAMSQLRQTIERVAPTNSRVMIVGPSGSGKELTARAIHALSSRKTGPFVTLSAATITPDVLFHAHSAPTGLVFYTGTSFPADYRGDAFVSLHGSWNAGNPTGYKVVRVHFTNGKPDNGYENFATGFWNGIGGAGEPAKVWGRPVGLAVAKDGSLLIADDTANVVWRVAYTGK